ncbi:MAG TPA: response regulator, partial [Methylomirabilota bacterium]|nr:response regulator [Methylomirabilota bacterium]
MTVLIADDNARFRRLLRTLLEGTTSIVAEAANGTEAVQLYHRHHPDWVLMDIRMTILDGLKAT